MSETKTRANLDYALNTVVGYRLKRAYMVMKDDYAADPNLAELTTRQFAVLSLTGGESGISQSDIARKLGIERSGMVKLIDQLESMGYLERIANPEDRRVYRLRLTEAGYDCLANHHEAVKQQENRVLASLNEQERKLLLTLLNRIQDQA